jgi:hypothetical protein
LAKVVVQCSALTFVVNPDCYRDATFAKLETVIGHLKKQQHYWQQRQHIENKLGIFIEKIRKNKKI